MPSILGLNRSRVLRRLVQGSAALLLLAAPALAQSKLWVHQFGGPRSDSYQATAPDGVGGVFAVGYLGKPGVPATSYDKLAILARYDSSGQRLWMHRLGTSGAGNAVAKGAASDTQGGVFVTGYAKGDFLGLGSGFQGSWLAHFDAMGVVTWIKSLTPPLANLVLDAAEDGSGGVLVCGGMPAGLGPDSWFARYDASGGLVWQSKHSFAGWHWDAAFSIAPDGEGGAFACGDMSITGELTDLDGWVARIDASGALKWRHRISTSGWDTLYAVVADGVGGVFVGGEVQGSVDGPWKGSYDAWLAHYDSDGSKIWGKQPGVPGSDTLYALESSEDGSLYAGVSAGPSVRVMRFDPDGSQIYSALVASSPFTDLYAMTSDSAGGVFIAGYTSGSVSGPNAGEMDAWIARFDGSCNPGTTYCVASSTSIPGCQASISATGSPTLTHPTAWSVSSGPVPGGNLGLLLFGSSGKDSKHYGTLGGQLCVASPTFRTAPKTSGGDQGQCNGSYAFALAELIAASPSVTSGATINAQVWARDPANQDGFLLSDGVEVTVCP